MQGKRILITGPTGQVGFPFTLHHAADNDVWAIARFGDESKREALALSLPLSLSPFLSHLHN